MIKIIKARKEVAALQKAFTLKLKRTLRHRKRVVVGYQGDSHTMTIYHDSNMWFTNRRSENLNRYWNAFGIELHQDRSNSITVEINVPKTGIHRGISALFATDEDSGDMFLLHRGRVGGGKIGIGKKAFTSWYDGKMKPVDCGDGRTDQAFLITSLSDPYIAENVAHFVRSVATFKSNVANGDSPIQRRNKTLANISKYNSEYHGKKSIAGRSGYTAECNHGRIVDGLKEYLHASKDWFGFEFWNSREIDLAATRNSRVLHIFEIKTNLDTQSVYTAIGQLMYHGCAYHNCSKTIVLPDGPHHNPQQSEILKQCGIGQIYYILGKSISFRG